MLIGLDFDNTIVRYDDVFAPVAKRLGWLPPEFDGDKQQVKAAVWSHGGEAAWMRLQGQVYGHSMAEALPAPGVIEFVRAARAAGVDLVVVSHKTERAHFDDSGVDLRTVARQWLADNGFFALNGGFAPDMVHFEATRAEKIARISRLGCDVFIDDLVEVIEDPAFPAGVRRCLFDPAGRHPGGRDYTVHRSWHDIARHLLD